jgi:hypothetical protein
VPADLREPGSDADGDGAPNWLEYVWRTRPDQADRPPLPQITVMPWGGIEVVVNLTADPAYALVAEFSSDVGWSSPQLEAGTWSPPVEGQTQAIFRYFPAGGTAFLRWRCYWQGAP